MKIQFTENVDYKIVAISQLQFTVYKMQSIFFTSNYIQQFS